MCVKYQLECCFLKTVKISGDYPPSVCYSTSTLFLSNELELILYVQGYSHIHIYLPKTICFMFSLWMYQCNGWKHIYIIWLQRLLGLHPLSPGTCGSLLQYWGTQTISVIVVSMHLYLLLIQYEEKLLYYTAGGGDH